MEDQKDFFIVRLIRSCPKYVWLNFVVLALIQILVFDGTRIPLAHMEIHNIETAWDRMIPFVPQWITIYFLSFAQWFFTGLLIGRESHRQSCFWATAYIVSDLIALVIFLAYPVTLERPEITGNGFWDVWMRFLYQVDSPTNLCPSLHVLASYFCWRGARDCDSLPKWFKQGSFVFLILVCLSILFVKQHVLVDIPTAIIVGELGIWLTRRFQLDRIMLQLDNKLLGGK